VLVGLLVGQPQQLLDAGTDAGQRGALILLELLLLRPQLLLETRELLLDGPQPVLGVGEPLLRLGLRRRGLRELRGDALPWSTTF
jgi:hypothetical protein